MKVLKKGNEAKSWSKKVVCSGKGFGGGGCRAGLLVEKSDLFHTYHYYVGDEAWFSTFECPECHVLTDIEAPFTTRELPSYRDWSKAK